MDIFSEKAYFKKPVLPENPVKKPAFNTSLQAFSIKPVFFQALINSQCFPTVVSFAFVEIAGLFFIATIC
jgi:hypothetical protein